jgi:hypothetical protein
MGPRQPTAELRELLTLIEEIRNTALDGVGNDALSNAALNLIKVRVDRLETVIKALDDTAVFDTRRILDVIRNTIRP